MWICQNSHVGVEGLAPPWNFLLTFSAFKEKYNTPKPIGCCGACLPCRLVFGFEQGAESQLSCTNIGICGVLITFSEWVAHAGKNMRSFIGQPLPPES